MSEPVQFHESEFVNILKKALDAYHELTEGQEGYEPIEGTGEDLTLMLKLNRTKNGGVRLSFMSVRDFLSTVSPGQLMRPDALDDFDKPTIPHVDVTMEPEN